MERFWPSAPDILQRPYTTVHPEVCNLVSKEQFLLPNSTIVSCREPLHAFTAAWHFILPWPTLTYCSLPRFFAFATVPFWSLSIHLTKLHLTALSWATLHSKILVHYIQPAYVAWCILNTHSIETACAEWISSVFSMSFLSVGVYTTRKITSISVIF